CKEEGERGRRHPLAASACGHLQEMSRIARGCGGAQVSRRTLDDLCQPLRTVCKLSACPREGARMQLPLHLTVAPEEQADRHADTCPPNCPRVRLPGPRDRSGHSTLNLGERRTAARPGRLPGSAPAEGRACRAPMFHVELMSGLVNCGRPGLRRRGG